MFGSKKDREREEDQFFSLNRRAPLDRQTMSFIMEQFTHNVCGSGLGSKYAAVRAYVGDVHGPLETPNGRSTSRNMIK